MKKYNNYKGVIWDMDGTLLNTLGDIRGSLNETLEKWGLPKVDVEQTLSYIGHGARYLCRCASHLDGEALDRFHAEYRAHSITRPEAKTHPYPGVTEILHDLGTRGIHIGIYTNKPSKWCTKLAHQFFGTGVFETVIGVDERQILKPSAEGIDIICGEWGISPSEAVMIGDSDVDYQTAVNGGCIAVCVSWGFRSEAFLRRAGADCIVPDAASLRQVLGI